VTIDQSMEHALSLYQAGRLAEAEQVYRRVLAQEPHLPQCLHMLGVLCAQTGRPDAAIDFLRRALALDTANPQALNNLANVLKDTGRLDEAVPLYQQALALKPDMATAHYNLADALASKGKLEQAVESYQRALACRPDFVPAQRNLAHLLRAMGRPDEAAASPGQPPSAVVQAESCNATAGALHAKGRLEEAIAAYQQAIALQPQNPAYHSNLGNVLRDNRQLGAAIAACRRALALDPNHAAAYSNLGNALRDSGKFDEAIAAYRRAVALKPDFAEALSNLANTCKDQGRLDEAIDSFRRALALRPNMAALHSNLVYALFYHPTVSAGEIQRELQEWNRRHALPHERSLPPPAIDASPGRRLRIGYVSADFRGHVVGSNFYPLLSRHDHEHFEIFCYAAVLRPDEMTGRLKQCADHWCNIVGLTDDEAAGLIRGDRIDVLVDLSGHTAGNRLPVFARKPAPVQVTYLGCLGSTGMTAIDYRLSDPYLDPPDMTDSYYSETTFRLPHTYWCYQPIGATPEVSALPSLTAGHVTFGCLTNFAKVSPAALYLWSQLLHAVPGSRLLLHCYGSARDGVRAHLEMHGIAAERLAFVPKRPWSEYIGTFAGIDVALDPFPFGGGISTCDTLWMGVPVVTLAGQTATGRAGVSILSNVGLTECIAADPDAYVAIARELAGDLSALARLRTSLRSRMEASPLMNARSFALDVEAAYQQIWSIAAGVTE
jgi:protein O-GlcNAc transferase